MLTGPGLCEPGDLDGRRMYSGLALRAWAAVRRVCHSGLIVAAAVALILLMTGRQGRAQEEIRQEYPTPSTVDQSTTPIQSTFTAPPQPETPLFPELRDRLRDAPAFLRDAKVDVGLRSYYLEEDKLDNTKSEAWALGGAISFQSGWIGDLLSVGGVYYTSQPLYAPSGRDGTNLLQPGQRGYSALGQIYARVKADEQTFLNLGRSAYDTPFINRNDSRMTPNTFEGYTLTGTAGDDRASVRYGAGYIDKIKLRNSEEFISMSRAAGAGVDRGVGVAGALVTAGGLSAGAIDYYSSDIVNIAYGEAKYTAPLPAGSEGALALQYADERNVGGNLLTGAPFSTNLVGVKIEGGRAGAILTWAYTIMGSGANLVKPWSGSPNYTSSMVQNFNRAGEQAVLAKLSYDLSRIGVDGVTTYALLAYGWTSATTAGPQPIRETEADLDLQWQPPWEVFKGLSVRARYGYVDVDQTTSHGVIHDMRLIMNYNLAVF